MHEPFIRRCFELAQQGAGLVSPNPMVGAVLVKNGKIIAEGFHARHGAAHAEADLFNRCDLTDFRETTLYINLEPCCHTKKLTPPCTPAILERKIPRVVISNLDPNPQVAGQSVKMLETAGVEVITGVLEAEGEELNEQFFHRMRTGRPFITLKAAATLDGKIALPSGESKWITSENSRRDAHYGRLLHDAVMIGAETLRRDNPALTVRIPHRIIEKQPYRIVLSASGKLPPEAQLFTDEFRHRTLVVTRSDTSVQVLPPQQVIRLSTLRPFPFAEFYQQLMECGIYSLWLEGGAGLHSLFLTHCEVQRLVLYMAPKIMGHGLDVFDIKHSSISDLLSLSYPRYYTIGDDLKVTARLKSN